MMDNYRIEKQDLLTWMVENEGAKRIPEIDERCNIEYLQSFLDARIPGCTVKTAKMYKDGVFDAPMREWVKDAFIIFNPTRADTFKADLHREFTYVEVMHETPAGDERIGFMIPAVWNGRFFAIGGGGTYTDNFWESCINPDVLTTGRVVTPDIVIKCGFATAWNDAALPNESQVWDPTDPETGTFNEFMLLNYDSLGMHTRNVVGKMLVEAFTGEQPSYSYTTGPSGGGRANLRIAQRYPEDVDGVWAEAPYCPYYACSAAITWTQVVLKNLGWMPIAKFEAFRDAVLARYGGLDKWLEVKDRTEFDACACIGTQTEAGPITETDAQIMNMIWDGPRRADGARLCYGWRPGTKFWDKPSSWFNYIFDEDGNIVDLPDWPVSTTAYALWVARDPKFNWRDLKIEDFEAWYDSFYEGFSKYDMLDDDIDLRRLVKAGTKLLVVAGTEDEFVPVDNTTNYYNEVVRATFGGDIEEARKHYRLFLAPGNDHITQLINDGYGPCISDTMIALMRWVEDGIAPDSIHGIHIDFATGGIDNEGEVRVY